MQKVLVVFGATGNQGRSVLQYFLHSARSHDEDMVIRGITRNLETPKAKELSAQGVDMVAADLDDVHSLHHALAGATHVFANTDSNQLIFHASKHPEILGPGETPTTYAKEVELRYGENLRQVLSGSESLIRVVWSSLTSPKKWSNGRFTKVTMFDAKEEIADLLRSESTLAGKLSILLVGFYSDNALNVPELYAPQKQGDGSYTLSFPMPGNVEVPFADVKADMGKWIDALFTVPAGVILVGASDTHTWDEWIKLWASVNGVRARYEATSLEAYSSRKPGMSEAVAEEFSFVGEYGFAGGNEKVVTPEALRVYGVDIQGTKLQDSIQACDWGLGNRV